MRMDCDDHPAAFVGGGGWPVDGAGDSKTVLKFGSVRHPFIQVGGSRDSQFFLFSSLLE